MADPVVIVGGTGAIGSALARRVAAAGGAVHLVGRDPARLAALAAELGGTHAVADAMDTDALGRAVALAGPRVAGLAYCVGSIVLLPLGRARPEDFVDAFRLNALGAAVAVAAAGEALRAVPGSGVVLFSSVAARAGFASHTVIATAKAAVEGLTVSLAAELAPHTRVNCIAPSLTRSGIASPMTDNATLSRAIAAQHPIPRLGEPDDAAAMAAFLLSPEAGWITGQVIGVDGGRSTVRTRG
ncbi:MAG: SDR family NAD(P)-dependent oxidoreductase [Janthinobacterium lividum]